MFMCLKSILGSGVRIGGWTEAIDDRGAEGKGQHFNTLGKAVQNLAYETIKLALPGVDVRVNVEINPKGGVGSVIDAYAKVKPSGRQIYVETKYKLPSSGPALTRATKQIENATDAADDRDFVVLNAAKPAGQAEVTDFKSNLNPKAAKKVQVVSNLQALYDAVHKALN